MNHYFLRTDRLILRKLREEDFPDYAVYAVDDEMSRMMGRALLKTEADIRQNFNWLKDHEPRCYGLVEQNSHCLIGNLSICSVPAPLFLFGVPAVLQCHFPGGRDKASCLHQSAQPFLLLCAGVSGHECRQCSGEFPLHRPAGRGLAAGRAQPHFLDKERPGHLEQSGVRAF